MFDLRRIPIVRVLLPFAGGSLAGYETLHPYLLTDLLIIAALMWILMAAMFHLAGRNSGWTDGLFTLFALSLFFTVGFATGILTRPSDPGLPLGEKVMVLGVITEAHDPGTDNLSFELLTTGICSKSAAHVIKTKLKVYMTVPPGQWSDHNFMWPSEGEVWRLYGQLVPITNSGNPGDIDFKAILNRDNCWYRLYANLDGVYDIQDQALLNQGWRDHPIQPFRIRHAMAEQWKGKGDEVSLLKAVCLGDRSDMPEELKLAYSRAGAMHILAVSGLHIGLIWWVLYHLLSWMVRLSGREILRSIAIVSILWLFAFVTGFSSSVSRSATMFTLFTAGRLMCRRVNALNGIMVSGFILIILNPSRMLEVGFQLSYAAILGIVTLYPVLRPLLTVKNRILNRVWEGTLVSVSAQLSTAPLVIYYFHQVPVYSLITNLIAIPLLSLLIATFVISVPFMFTGIGSHLFNWILMKLAFMINFSVEKVASFPGGVVNGLNLDKTSLWLCMGILCTMMIVLNRRAVLARYLLIGLISATLCWTARCTYLQTHLAEMVIGHFRNASIITFREGTLVDHYCLFGDSTSIPYVETYITRNWSRRRFQTRVIELLNQNPARGSCSEYMELAPGIWILGNNRIRGWVISGTLDQQANFAHVIENERTSLFNGEFVLLNGNPSIGYIPEAILYHSGEVILDGSNEGWYTAVIENLNDDSLGFVVDYKTAESGAYLKRW